MSEWQSADDRNNREKINRARQAAEDLFKPTRHEVEAVTPAAAPNDVITTETRGRRQPRIFSLPPRVLPDVHAEPEAKPKPMPRRPIARQPAKRVPDSQIGRIRTLTRYGMTREQVAELYDVTVAEIERIIRDPANSGKSG